MADEATTAPNPATEKGAIVAEEYENTDQQQVAPGVPAIPGGKKGIGMGRAAMATDMLTRIADRLDERSIRWIVVLFGLQFLLTSLSVDIGDWVGQFQRDRQEYRMEQLEILKLEKQEELIKLQIELSQFVTPEP